MVWALSLSDMDLIIHNLTAAKHLYGIQSLICFGRLIGPLGNSVLYLH